MPQTLSGLLQMFYLFMFQGCIYVYQYPEMELEHVLQAHPGNCICIEFDKTGRDGVSLWDVQPLACVRTFSRLVSWLAERI